MKPNIFLPRLAAITLLACVLAACGQRGPLYMPGSKPPPKPKTTQVPKQATPGKQVTTEETKAPTVIKPEASAPEKQ